MNGIHIADLTFSAITGRMPFDTQKIPRWKVYFEDRETGEDKDVTVISPTLPKACAYVEEEYGNVLSIENIML